MIRRQQLRRQYAEHIPPHQTVSVMYRLSTQGKKSNETESDASGDQTIHDFREIELAVATLRREYTVIRDLPIAAPP